MASAGGGPVYYHAVVGAGLAPALQPPPRPSSPTGRARATGAPIVKQTAPTSKTANQGRSVGPKVAGHSGLPSTDLQHPSRLGAAQVPVRSCGYAVPISFGTERVGALRAETWCPVRQGGHTVEVTGEAKPCQTGCRGRVDAPTPALTMTCETSRRATSIDPVRSCAGGAYVALLERVLGGRPRRRTPPTPHRVHRGTRPQRSLGTALTMACIAGRGARRVTNARPPMEGVST